MSTRDSQASFNTIRRIYRNRCTICLNKLSPEGSQCAHLFDSSARGQIQVDMGVELGTIPKDYRRSSVENGTIQCGTCHLGLFTPNHVSLSPPWQVLQYILKFLQTRDAADRRPLHEVFSLLVSGSAGQQVDLPEFAPIVPYIGLYSLVHLHPDALEDLAIPILSLPNLSIIRGRRFVPAPAGTSPIAPNVARIFDSMSLPDRASIVPGAVPLSPSMPGFDEQRFWRLPVNQGVILELLMQRAVNLPGHNHVEIQLARAIYSILTLQALAIDVDASGLGDPGPSSSGGAVGENQGGGRRKRKKDEDKGGPPAARRGKGTGRGGTTQRASMGTGTVAHNEIADDFHVGSPTPPVNGDAPICWEFGPSLTTNEIIFYARATILT